MKKSLKIQYVLTVLSLLSMYWSGTATARDPCTQSPAAMSEAYEVVGCYIDNSQPINTPEGERIGTTWLFRLSVQYPSGSVSVIGTFRWDDYDETPGGDPDMDGDGVSDDLDNCPTVSNSDQLDTDGDGIGDVCDDPLDADSDGVSDDEDNCPNDSNADQIDSNGNGKGDVCDASVLFRENNDDYKENTWGRKEDEIPGFDHVGFNFGNAVYESHPGYPSGTYVSDDGKESIDIEAFPGVQISHLRSTFVHDSMSVGTSPINVFEEISVEEELSKKMEAAIGSVLGSLFHRPVFGSVDVLIESLSPTAQKGGMLCSSSFPRECEAFTCVGLIEWSAEQAGHNSGQGFIRNTFESFSVPDPRSFSLELIEVPLLSPALLNYAMKGQQLLQNVQQWVQGLFDPVDFIVTDPLGRRLGFVQTVGHVNEIPNSFYSGDGGVEQFLIPNAIPGNYVIKLVGIGSEVFAAVAASGSYESFAGPLASGESKEKMLYVKPLVGCGGDVNYDGDVDQEDIDKLITILGSSTNGLGHPGDLNGDGLLSDIDLSLLTDLVDNLSQSPISTPQADPSSGSAPLEVKFTANATDLGGDALTYAWDFGDPDSPDNTSTVANPTHTYNTPGTYIAWLSVSNGQNDPVEASVTVVVDPDLSLSVKLAKITKGPRNFNKGLISISADFNNNNLQMDDIIAIYADDIELVNATLSAFKPGRLSEVYLIVEPKLLVRLDLRKMTLFVQKRNTDLKDLNTENGLDVELHIGSSSVVENILMKPLGRRIQYYTRN